MKYYIIENTGKGFITHEENESSNITGYPANIWVTDNTSWAARVGATEITKEEAQALIDTAYSEYLTENQAFIDASDPSEQILNLQLEIERSTPPLLP